MTTTTTNPFVSGEMSALFDPRTYMQAFQVPGVDTNALIETQRKNIEAFTQAQRTALDGVQRVVARQAELARELPKAHTDAVSRAGRAGSAEAGVAEQTEAAKQTYETAVQGLRELADLGASVQQSTFDTVTKRVTESFDEVRNSVTTAA